MTCYICERKIRPWDRYGFVAGISRPMRSWHVRCLEIYNKARRDSLRGLFPKVSDAALDRAIAHMDSARKGLS